MSAAPAPAARAMTAWAERCRQLSEPVVEACATTPVASGSAALAREIGRLMPDWPFQEVLCRGGWYRLGGVVGESGARISDHVAEWASDALDERDGDLAALIDDYAASALRATHVTGRTHYFVSPVRDGGSTDYLQLEIEDLQETYAQPLFNRSEVPGSLDELIDARCDQFGICDACEHGDGSRRCGMPLGKARYRFRRLTHIGDLLARMRTQSLEAQPIHRFVADWDASSAGTQTAICNHWAFALAEHLDRYRQTITRATPVAAFNGELPKFGAREGTSGLSLHAALLAFDRAVGYPMAWYFQLIAAKAGKAAVPHWVPAAVASDAVAGFSYLPERDLAVVKHWLHKPYAF
jgi:hypothetical protein